MGRAFQTMKLHISTKSKATTARSISFSKEPIEVDNPLLKNKKVILSPHSATFTDECTSRMGIETTKNIIDFFDNAIDESMIVKL